MDYPRYDSYKDSGVDWLGEIPESWSTEKGKWLFHKMDRPIREDDGIVTCFRDGEVTLRSNRRTDGFTNALKEHGYQGIRKGDLVIHQMDAFAGAIGVSDSEGKSTPVYSVCVPQEPNKTLPYYYMYFMRSMALRGFILSLAKGIRERSTDFRYNDFAKLDLPIPPYDVQVKISEFIENKTIQIDQAIKLKQQQIAKLEEYKQIVIQNAVTKGLNPDAPMKDSGVDWIGNIPKHWEIKKLKFISRINNSTLPEKTNSKLEIKYVDIGSVTFEERVVSTEAFDFGNAPSRARRIAKNHDTIISTVRTYLKAIDYIDNKKSNYIYSTGFAVLTPNQQIEPKFLTFFVWSNAFTNQVRDFSKGVSYPAINSSDLGNLFISLPPHEEQKETIEYIDNKSRQINSSINNIKLGIDRLKEYKTILINQAVTGKIKVV